MIKIKNPKAEFYEVNNFMYMSLDFDVVERDGIKLRYSIPKINFQGMEIDQDMTDINYSYFVSDSVELKFKVSKADGKYYSVQDMSPKEITIEEIEKKLGHKIKIVG